MVLPFEEMLNQLPFSICSIILIPVVFVSWFLFLFFSFLFFGGGCVASSKAHDTIYGDCFDWLKRLAKRVQPSACDGGFEGQFDVVILDPPTTSTGTAKKRWSAAKVELGMDSSRLVGAASLKRPPAFAFKVVTLLSSVCA